MRKILAVLVILAALLSVGCKQGVVLDIAGNPAALTGTWLGSITVKETVPFSVFTDVGGTIYEGTWVKETVTTPPATMSATSTTGTTTTTTNYIFTPTTTTVNTTRVVAADGSYVHTQTTTASTAARAAITVPANTVYVLDANPITLAGGTTYVAAATVPAQVDGVVTTTDVTTVTVTPVAESDGTRFDQVTDVVETVRYSGTAYPSTGLTQTVTPLSHTVLLNVLIGSLTFYTSIPAGSTQTVTFLQPEYQNDAVYSYSFAIAADGTYVLTETKVTTQADIAAAAAADGYAASEAVVAGVKTENVVFSGTVAAWNGLVMDSFISSPVDQIVFSGVALETSTVGTGAFLDATTNWSTWSAMFDYTYLYRMLTGTKTKDAAAMSRLVIDNFRFIDLTGLAPITATLVLDKQ